MSALRDMERELRDTLATKALLEDRPRFARLLQGAMDLLALDDGDVADKLPAGRSSVRRWREGVTAPSPRMRIPIYQLLLRRVANSARDTDGGAA